MSDAPARPPGGPIACELRPATAADRATFLALHGAGFADSEAALLGPRYVGAQFDALLVERQAFVWLATGSDGPALGFVAGSRWGAERARYRRLLPIALAAFVARPRLLAEPRFRRILRWRLGTLGRPTGGRLLAALEPPIALLDLIAVDPAARGRGVGDRLMEGFARAASERGARSFVLWVRPDALPARRLYSRHGWRELGPIETGRLAYARASADATLP